MTFNGYHMLQCDIKVTQLNFE